MKTREKLAGRVLFINSAADQTRIGLFFDNKIIAEKTIESRLELSDKLLMEIDQLMKASSFQPEAVAVFSGPGSYTGLRIGVTTANFLAWSLNIPVYPADSDGKIIGDKKDFVLPKYLKAAHITKKKKF